MRATAEVHVSRDTHNSDGPERRAAMQPSPCCRRLWNLIMTGYVRCPKCGFPDRDTAYKFWKEWPGI